MKNILFVCSANVDRSRTAEDFFGEQLDRFHFTSAGTNEELCRKEGTIHLTQAILNEADLVLVMEDKHLQWIREHLETENKRIEVLQIPDHYRYYSMDLIELLQKACQPYFH